MNGWLDLLGLQCITKCMRFACQSRHGDMVEIKPHVLAVLQPKEKYRFCFFAGFGMSLIKPFSRELSGMRQPEESF